MASIEVSLSSTPRRKKCGNLMMGNLSSSIRSIPKELAVKELESLRNALRDKENIIQTLKGQLTIPGLRLAQIRNGTICNNNNNNTSNNNGNNHNGNANNNGGRELSEVEKKQAEERLSRLKSDTDHKRLTIKNLKMALERLDITDNIDVRIQQAELEYQLGREELNLLTLLEETRALQLCLEESNRNNCGSHTLYSCINNNDNNDRSASLCAVEIIFDPKSPRFGAGPKESVPGLWVDWALEETGICKGDRIIEVNGKIVLNRTREDLARLLAAAPDPAQMVLLRKIHSNNTTTKLLKDSSLNSPSKEVATLRDELEVVRERAEEAQRAKDGLRSDNIRLTHRISYLEEQVAELLSTNRKTDEIRIVPQSPVITSTVKTSQNVTNINISSQPTAVQQKNDLQVFQKGPQVTALVANLPGLETTKETLTNLPVRSKSSMSNVSNTHIPAPALSMDHSCHKSHRHRQHRTKNNLVSSSSTQYLALMDQQHKKHHHHHHQHQKDYSSETNSAVDQPTSASRQHQQQFRLLNESNLMDQSYKKATKIVQELTKNKDSSLYEKHKQKCSITASEKYNTELLRHYNARKSSSVLDFRSQLDHATSAKLYKDSKSVERLDHHYQQPPNERRLYKKLHDSRSVKSLDFDNIDSNSPNNNYKNQLQKNVDYTSEPIENNVTSITKRNHHHYHNFLYESSGKPRPTPPKKPVRLSLQRAQSLQSVETPPGTPGGSPTRNGQQHQQEGRKLLKRANYKIDGMVAVQERNEFNGQQQQQGQMKWTNFSQMRQRESAIQETGNWC